MTQPVVTQAGEEMYGSLAPIAAADPDNNWAILVLCDAMMRSVIQPIIAISRDSADGPGWSALLDLNRVPSWAIPYLGLFVGVVTQPSNTDDQNKDLILNRPPWKRGRPATMLAAIQAQLTGSKLGALLERDTSAYHATVRVYRAQVPDEDALRAAIAASKPGMIIVDLDILDGPTYGDIQDALTANTYGARVTMFPTYGDVQEFI